MLWAIQILSALPRFLRTNTPWQNPGHQGNLVSRWEQLEFRHKNNHNHTEVGYFNLRRRIVLNKHKGNASVVGTLMYWFWKGIHCISLILS